MSRFGRLFDQFRNAVSGREQTRSEARWIAAGLGNPDEKYLRSRHNLGFRAMDRIARAQNAEFRKHKFKGLIAEVRIAEEPVLLVKPQTYYNNSGDCVAAILGYFKVAPGRLIVVHDEIDLQAGRLRGKRGGRCARHRGVRAISATRATQT